MTKGFFTELDHPKPRINFKDCPVLVRAEFAFESDINNILKRYATTGWLVDPNSPRNDRKPQWDDYSKMLDYQDSLDKCIDAQQRFDALPVEIRERFNYDPAKLLAFLDKACSDKKSTEFEEAVRLRLVSAPPPPDPPKPDDQTPPAS